MAEEREAWLAIMRGMTALTISSIFIMGLNVSGAGTYFANSARGDRWWLIALVTLSMVFDTLQMVGFVQGTWEALISEAGSYSSLRTFPPAWAISQFTGFEGSLIAQGYYCWRTYAISRNKTVLAISIILMGGPLSCYLGQGILRTMTPSISTQAKGQHVVLVYFWSGLVCEVWLSGTFIYFSHKSKKGFNEVTDAIFVRLARAALEASVPTVLLGFTGAVLYVAQPNQYYWCVFYSSISPSYTFGVLYSLNQRPHVRRHVADRVEAQKRVGVQAQGVTRTLSVVLPVDQPIMSVKAPSLGALPPQRSSCDEDDKENI